MDNHPPFADLPRTTKQNKPKETKQNKTGLQRGIDKSMKSDSELDCCSVVNLQRFQGKKVES
jgi:hypothetical protein